MGLKGRLERLAELGAGITEAADACSERCASWWQVGCSAGGATEQVAWRAAPGRPCAGDVEASRRPTGPETPAEAAGNGGAGRRRRPGVRSGDRLGGVGRGSRGTGHGSEQSRGDRRAARETMERGRGQQPNSTERGGGDDQRPQPGLPCRGAFEQHVRPAGTAGDGDRGQQTCHERVAMLPQQCRADRDQRADRRCERDLVVGVDDALAEAEHRRCHEQPTAPQQQPSTSTVGARRTAPLPDPSGEREQRSRQQPRRLAAHDAVEQAQQPGRAAERTASAEATGPAWAALAEDPSEAVIAGDQIENAVVGRAVDERPRTRRPQRDDRDPPARTHEHRNAAGEQLHDAPTKPGRRGHDIHQRKAGEHDERLHHLRQKREADHHPYRQHPLRARVLKRTRQTVRSSNQQQREQSIGVVESEHQRRDWRKRKHRTGDQPGTSTEPALDRGVEQRNRGNALESLGDQHAPATKAKDPCRELHHPQ